MNGRMIRKLKKPTIIIPKLEVIIGEPPMMGLIEAKFHVRGQPVLFSWGSRIYNPQGVAITPELFVHEGTHQTQQGREIEAWWLRYIADGGFRLAQELPAHRNEMAAFANFHRDRNERFRRLDLIARRLSGPLYGGLIPYLEVRKVLIGDLKKFSH